MPEASTVSLERDGHVLLIGLKLVLASDVRIAASDARFAQIEIKRGTDRHWRYWP